jgi:methionyl-tRNA formyltransferase
VVGVCFGRLTLNGYANRKKIPYFWLHKENEHEFIKWMQCLGPDLLLSYSMSQLLSSAALNVPKFGAFNIHPSILPDYRGPNPWFWVYRDGNSKSGVTIHQIDEGEDTGPIFAQAHFPIQIGQSLEISINYFQESATKLLQDLLTRLKKGDLELYPQAPISSTIRAKNPTHDDIKNLANWSEWTASRAYHFLSGIVNQYPALISQVRERQPYQYLITGFSLSDTGEKFKHCEGHNLVCSDGHVYYVAHKRLGGKWSYLFRALWR